MQLDRLLKEHATAAGELLSSKDSTSHHLLLPQAFAAAPVSHTQPRLPNSMTTLRDFCLFPLVPEETGEAPAHTGTPVPSAPDPSLKDNTC